MQINVFKQLNKICKKIQEIEKEWSQKNKKFKKKQLIYLKKFYSYLLNKNYYIQREDNFPKDKDTLVYFEPEYRNKLLKNCMDENFSKNTYEFGSKLDYSIRLKKNPTE